MIGKIYKGFGGFYYVHTKEGDYECRAKGIFRLNAEKPLIGDMVEIETVVDSEKPFSGNVVKILPRRNVLLRPPVSNIDQVVIVFSLKDPDPSLLLLDRILVCMEEKQIPVLILLNKADLLKDSPEMEEYKRHLLSIYEEAGFRVFLTEFLSSSYRDCLSDLFKGKTSVLCGPSGVGKSTLINLLNPGADRETGKISRKIRRGKNTTRHTELIYLEGKDAYIMDTPGFGSLYVPDIASERLMYYFPEFENLRGFCRFNTCLHLSEPDCAVRKAVLDGVVAKERYLSYCSIYKELREGENYA